MLPTPPAPNSGPSEDPAVAPVVRRNISALADMRAAEARRLTRTDRLVEVVTRFAGSMGCVYAHLLVIGTWVLVNLGWFPGVRPFDPRPFPLLGTAVGTETIFLSLFILISQNRARAMAERRAELHLQIGLLTEHELTRAVHLLDAMADRFGVRHDDLEDVKRDVHPENVVDEIVRAEDASGNAER